LKKTRSYKIICFAVVATIFLSLFGNSCFGAKAERVAIIPFDMNSDQDLSFLQNGIFDMLSSRISDGDKVSVLTRDEIDSVLEKAKNSASAKGKLNRSKARIIGANLGVEYVLFGSLTVIGENVSLDAQMIDVAGDKPDVTFSDQTEKLGGVIPLVNLFAKDVNSKVFDRDVGREREQRQQQYAQQQQTNGQYQQPNQSGYYYSGNAQTQGQSQGYYSSPLGRFRNLLAVKGEINGIAVGDVDGDKRNEVVIVYDHKIEILKDNGQGHLQTIQEIEDSYVMDLIGVEVLDLNKNGRAEIFVTRSRTGKQKIESFVIEFNGKEYEKITKKLPWYFKAVNNINGQGKLYAQVNRPSDGPYASSQVFEVDWEDETYIKGEKLKAPRGFSITSMVKGSIADHGSSNYVFTDKNGRLTIFDDAGSVQFAGEKYYGGSNLKYELPRSESRVEDEVTYFQPDNLLFDIDSDGKEEVIAIKNIETSDYFIEKRRSFNSGIVQIMTWDELGIAPKNAPVKMPGKVTSIQIGDINNDSKMELIVGFRKRKGGMLSGKEQSLLISYELIKLGKPAQK
jgi:TolB-like protein